MTIRSLLVLLLILTLPCTTSAATDQDTVTPMAIQAEAEATDQQRLMVRGVDLPAVESTFSQRYPDIELAFDYESISAEEVAQMLLSRDSSVDVFEVCVDYAFSSLMKKDFASDLSVSEIIRGEVAQMESAIVSTITDELMDAWILWETEYADEYPDIEFSLGFDYAAYCQRVITFFVQQSDTNGAQPNLNDPALRRILTKLQQVYEIRVQAERSTSDTGAVSPEGVAGMVRFRAWDAAMDEQSASVMHRSENMVYDLYMGNHTNVPLAFASGDTPQTDGTLYVYVVNPYSKNMDAAIKYVECLSEIESEPYIYYTVHPDCNEPCEDPHFQALIESAVQQKAELEETIKSMEGGDPVDRVDVQAMIDYYDHLLDNKESERWLISAQTIESQRKLLQSLHLHTESLYLGAQGSRVDQMIAGLCSRYADGSMTMDVFLSELSKKVNMMQLENE